MIESVWEAARYWARLAECLDCLMSRAMLKPPASFQTVELECADDR
jgi:hypothetical protein